MLFKLWWPLSLTEKISKDQRNKKDSPHHSIERNKEKKSKGLLRQLVNAEVNSSGNLVYILFFKFKTVCQYVFYELVAILVFVFINFEEKQVPSPAVEALAG